MARHQEDHGLLFEGDFGLSALAGRVASSPAPPDEDRVLRLAAEVAGNGEGAAELGLDLARLLESGLPDETLDAVWTAATANDPRPPATGAGTRALLSRLAESYPPPPSERSRARARETELPAVVVAEAVASRPDLGDPATEPESSAGASTTLAEAVSAVARHADAELGLRLLLRVLKTRRVAVAKDQYDRLTAIGARLGWPGPLVHDGLKVRWPPVDPARRDGEGDFGLSALTSWFPWDGPGTTAHDCLRGAAAADDTAQTPGSAAAVLLVDALRLLESPLSDDTIAALWRGATGGGHDIAYLRLGPREWLRTIADACRARLAEAAPDHRHTVPPADTAQRDAVLSEVRDAAALLTGVPDATAALAAVEEVVSRVDPDLGYRLLLRLLGTRRVHLTEERYARHLSLCEHFGYGAEHVSEGVELLRHH
ncbi:hypothetical protein ACFYNX_08140 [Streptomyces sp. NPDC007872]|uniref:hypothetical protein n=1 Tax=Streptomyces sp. NPDC007872 TaxID=3364782 RepID=UPI0036C7857A